SAGQPFGPLTVGAAMGAVAALAVAAVLGYWTYALASLSYALDRNGLVIRWGITRQVIPLEAIERLVPGTAVGVPRVRGVSWLGYHIGRARIPRIGEVLFYSTHQAPEEVLYVMTTERNYAISVPDPAALARQIEVRQDLGPTAAVTHHVERAFAPLQGFWADRAGWLLAAGAVALCGAVWLALAAQYDGLPGSIAVRFPLREALPLVEVNAKSVLLAIPRAATVVLAIDLAAGIALYTWDRTVAHLVLLAAIAIEIGFLVALQATIARA
ncbi:MAG: hypothetical protein EXR64_06190, partial [Dehalococcoidia bacterium]|nr:hypothetical protein [Dehalococcoidia bacterium]